MVKLVYILRRRDDITPEKFHDYWLNNHGPLVRSFVKAIRARKYIQSHTIAPELGAEIAATRGMGAGYDGITEVWWDSLEDLSAGFSTPEGREAGRALLEDEAKFIDFARSYIFLTEEHTIFDL
ncbi:MAG TPA: EthD domain-containing protein [Candidatus Binataceae bacterium]|nr:EthD domain-containing protein [Candidatus Binataceae bacterium]